MKKTSKRVGLAILAVAAVAAVVGAVNFSPMLSMTPAETGEVAGTGVTALNNRLNSLYLIPSEDGYILVDAGSNASTVERGLADIGIGPADVGHVLLTHSDSDHVAALSLFPGAQIYMSGEEVTMVDGTTKRNAMGRNSLPSGVGLEDVSLLEDAQVLELGGRTVACTATPGHTPGSMSFLVDGAYLFTGDALLVRDGGAGIHPFTMDGDAAAASIAMLEGLMRDAAYVFTAHYGVYDAAVLAAEK